MDGSKLYIYKIVANQAPTLKRTNPRARGSADLLKKRYSHIEITLSDDSEEMKKDLKKIKDLKTKRAQANKGYSAKQRKENLAKVSKDSKPKKTVVKKVAVSKTSKPKTTSKQKIEKGSK